MAPLMRPSLIALIALLSSLALASCQCAPLGNDEENCAGVEVSVPTSLVAFKPRLFQVGGSLCTPTAGTGEVACPGSGQCSTWLMLCATKPGDCDFEVKLDDGRSHRGRFAVAVSGCTVTVSPAASFVGRTYQVPANL